MTAMEKGSANYAWFKSMIGTQGEKAKWQED